MTASQLVQFIQENCPPDTEVFTVDLRNPDRMIPVSENTISYVDYIEIDDTYFNANKNPVGQVLATSIPAKQGILI